MGANYGGSGGSRKFFSIIDGQCVENVKEHEALNPQTGQLNPGYTTRLNKKGNRVYERVVAFGLSGKISKLELEAHPQYGRQLVIGIEDEGTVYELKFSAVNSNKSFTDYARTFIEQVRFVDFGQFVRINPWKWEPEPGKVKYGMSIFVESDRGSGTADVTVKKLNEEAIKAYREALPPAVESPDPLEPGKSQWDWTQQSVTIFNELQAQIKRLLQFNAQGMVANPPTPATAATHGTVEAAQAANAAPAPAANGVAQPDSDLPF